MSQNKEVVNELFSAESAGKNNLDNTWDVFHKRAFNLSDTSFVNTIIGAAAQTSVNQSIKAITRNIQGN
jgi:hypothetical protein